MNKYNLATSLIKSFEQNPNYGAAILEDLIHYKFLVGRFQLLVKDYKNAFYNLKFSFEKCPVSISHNRMLILMYLIPTNLKLGIIPSPTLLSLIEPCNPLIAIIQSFTDGNVRLFKETLLKSKKTNVACFNKVCCELAILIFEPNFVEILSRSIRHVNVLRSLSTEASPSLS
ncbi:hypothetical protein HZS_12 [Henneguya salminicola]|nr:hypothetical protein HZS_12 [Henneguya salminicola]